jgi:hypothetical protein
MDGHNHTKDFRIRDELNQCANLYRPAENPAQTVMLLGQKHLQQGKRPQFEEVNRICGEDEEES